MARRLPLNLGAVLLALCILNPWTAVGKDKNDSGGLRFILASDTILSSVLLHLLPPERFVVEAVLPPGQCPGHYDVKLTDIRKFKMADLTVSFKGLPFMDKAAEGLNKLLIDAGGRNWMAPDSFIFGLDLLSKSLLQFFPEEEDVITRRRDLSVRIVRDEAAVLKNRIREAGLSGKAVIASGMQREPVEWMGFSIAGEYGRPEPMSAREFIRLVRLGKEQGVIAVIDNHQSGPDTGKGIAEALGVPRVVLTNFPSDKGYIATLKENVESLLLALGDR